MLHIPLDETCFVKAVDSNSQYTILCLLDTLRRRRRPPDLLEALGQPDLPPDRVDPRQRAERDVALRRARDDARAPAFVGDEGRVPLLL